jgi:hypothetical protein
VKILFLGSISEGQTSRMRMRALQRLGHDVKGIDTIEPWRISWWRRQVERRLERGAVIDAINRSVLDAARHFSPDIVWGEKQEYLRADTLRKLRKDGAKLMHFTPDPYFSLAWKRTRSMDEALYEFDALFYCKKYERSSYEALNKPLVYLPLGYCDEMHRPLVSGDSRWASGLGFLGGWEPRREHLIKAVIDLDVTVKIWGGYWDFLRDGKWTLRRHIILGQLAGSEPYRIHRDAAIANACQGGEVYGDDYARALTGAKMGLGLLRKVCPDQHTTRTFEIPACGSMLVADRTEEHQEFFAEGTEAEFFSSVDELCSKVMYYSANETARRNVANAGRQRCLTSGYSYYHRLKAALSDIARML